MLLVTSDSLYLYLKCNCSSSFGAVTSAHPYIFRPSFHEPIQSCDVMVVSCELLLQELQDLKQEKQQLQQKCEQQEQALQEMGLHLSQSVPSHFSNPLLKQMHRFVSRGSCVALVFI